MRRGPILAAAAAVAFLAQPALADQRWLACKFTDQGGTVRDFFMMFDDLRSVASLLDAGTMVEGKSTSITFQAIRTNFPAFGLTYNRNDGALTITPTGVGGLLRGECRRAPPPPGAPRS